MAKKKVTSMDVAKLAGVSQSAVSLILNKSDKVVFSEETKERVKNATRQLGYQTPAHRRRKSESDSKLIPILIPTLTNAYYSELVQCIEQYAGSLGYHVIICNTREDTALEKYYINTFIDSKIAGIIYSFLPSFPQLAEQLSQTIPTVIIGEKKDTSICSIELNNQTAGALIAEHLYSLGHTHFAFISTPLQKLTMAREQRLKGIQSVLDHYGCSENLDIRSASEQFQKPDNEGWNTPNEYILGRRLTKKLLKEGTLADALIGVNDMVAIGIIEELKSEGYKVPEDFSVCGFDDIFWSRTTFPSLTTINHQLYNRCKTAIDLIVHHQTSTSFASRIEYAPQLIVRQSTGPAVH